MGAEPLEPRSRELGLGAETHTYSREPHLPSPALLATVKRLRHRSRPMNTSHDRRTFLEQAAATAGAAALPLAGCATGSLRAGFPALDESAADAMVARFRRALADASTRSVVTDAVARVQRPDGDAPAADLAHADALAEKAVRALLVADLVGNLQRGGASSKADDILGEFGPALDDAIYSHAALLHRTPVREKRRIDEVLRREGDVPMRVGEALDEHARRFGVSPETRGKMRRLLTDLTTRSRAQSLSAIGEECVDKVRRVSASRGDEAVFARALATQGTSSALWTAAQVPLGQAPWASASTPPRPTTNATPPPASAPGAIDPSLVTGPPPSRPRSGTSTIRAGAIMSGVGVAVFGLGLLGAFAEGGIALAVVATLGGILLLAGLITLLVGAIMYASS